MCIIKKSKSGKFSQVNIDTISERESDSNGNLIFAKRPEIESNRLCCCFYERGDRQCVDAHQDQECLNLCSLSRLRGSVDMFSQWNWVILECFRVSWVAPSSTNYLPRKCVHESTRSWVKRQSNNDKWRQFSPSTEIKGIFTITSRLIFIRQILSLDVVITPKKLQAHLQPMENIKFNPWTPSHDTFSATNDYDSSLFSNEILIKLWRYHWWREERKVDNKVFPPSAQKTHAVHRWVGVNEMMKMESSLRRLILSFSSLSVSTATQWVGFDFETSSLFFLVTHIKNLRYALELGETVAFHSCEEDNNASKKHKRIF